MPHAQNPNSTSATLPANATVVAADRAVQHHLLHTVGAAPATATHTEIMHAVAQVAREQLSQRWVVCDSADRAAKARRVYYLSMEFLIGRTLSNALAALDLKGDMGQAARAHAATLEDLAATEADAALGNGGLGRLAACFLDSMATVELPSFGYGIRYEFGMFKQSIQDGRQVEYPDPWLEEGTPWEFPRSGVHYPVRFGGWVEPAADPSLVPTWRHAGEVNAKAYDMVIPGHGTSRVSTLRLWKAVAPSQIDLHAFNSGDYARAAEFKNEYENISWVLYPTTALRLGANCGCDRNTSSPARPSRTSWRATRLKTVADAAHSPTCRTRWPSTSMTPTRPSAWLNSCACWWMRTALVGMRPGR